MSLPPVSVVHINIHHGNFQANTVLGSGRRGHVTQWNNIHHHTPVTETHTHAPHSELYLPTAIERRVEAQPGIRRTLEEVSTQPEYVSSRIGHIALMATGILAVVEQEYPSISKRLIDLVMDAHAVAYIVVISFLHRRLRMSRKRADKLTELLVIIHKLVAEAAATGNFVVLLRKLATKNQRKSKATRTREELLNLLRKIEKNNDADVLSSLNSALQYHHQHTDIHSAEVH